MTPLKKVKILQVDAGGEKYIPFARSIAFKAPLGALQQFIMPDGAVVVVHSHADVATVRIAVQEGGFWFSIVAGNYYYAFGDEVNVSNIQLAQYQAASPYQAIAYNYGGVYRTVSEVRNTAVSDTYAHVMYVGSGLGDRASDTDTDANYPSVVVLTDGSAWGETQTPFIVKEGEKLHCALDYLDVVSGESGLTHSVFSVTLLEWVGSHQFTTPDNLIMIGSGRGVMKSDTNGTDWIAVGDRYVASIHRYAVYLNGVLDNDVSTAFAGANVQPLGGYVLSDSSYLTHGIAFQSSGNPKRCVVSDTSTSTTTITSVNNIVGNAGGFTSIDSARVHGCIVYEYFDFDWDSGTETSTGDFAIWEWDVVDGVEFAYGPFTFLQDSLLNDPDGTSLFALYEPYISNAQCVTNGSVHCTLHVHRPANGTLNPGIADKVRVRFYEGTTYLGTTVIDFTFAMATNSAYGRTPLVDNPPGLGDAQLLTSAGVYTLSLSAKRNSNGAALFFRGEFTAGGSLTLAETAGVWDNLVVAQPTDTDTTGRGVHRAVP